MRELRRNRHWTQRELAARLGLSQSRLSELERGAGSFTAEQLLVVARLFNVPPSEFGPAKPADENAELQNALARYGATHLQERDDVTPDADLGLARAIREALVSGVPRLITAVAPVLALHIDRISLNKLHADLAESGFEHRLSWLLDNTLAALRSEAAASIPGAWAKRYRRAVVVIEARLEAVLPRRRDNPGIDLLDIDVRSARSRKQLEAAASEISRRWGVVTSLQPDDFVHALRAARVQH